MVSPTLDANVLALFARRPEGAPAGGIEGVAHRFAIPLALAPRKQFLWGLLATALAVAFAWSALLTRAVTTTPFQFALLALDLFLSVFQPICQLLYSLIMGGS